MTEEELKMKEEETRLRLIYEYLEQNSLSDCVKRAKKGKKQAKIGQKSLKFA